MGFLKDQRVRFLAVGGANTAVGYLIFSAFTLWVFVDVPLGYLLSLALSYVVGITLAFVLYRRPFSRRAGAAPLRGRQNSRALAQVPRSSLGRHVPVAVSPAHWRKSRAA